MTERDLKPENVPHDPLSVPCRICNAKVGERCATITSPIRFLDEPHFTRRPRPERDLCSFCGDDLGREVARGSHYNCRLALVHAVRNLIGCLVDAGALERAFSLGLYNELAPDVVHSVHWLPGHEKAAP